MSDEVRFFNFPIVLIEGFMDNPKNCLENISDYALYVKAESYEEGNKLERMQKAMKFFGVTVSDVTLSHSRGRDLFDSIPDGVPKVGLNISVFWDYYKNDKDDFQKVCLLGFLAIKSILQDKAYCCIGNRFWLARMDGKTHSVKDYSELSSSVYPYASEYQTKKIKSELIRNWGLEHYSRYMRGFYVTFKLSLEQLIFEAEKRRKSNIDKKRKAIEKEAREKALAKLAFTSRP